MLKGNLAFMRRLTVIKERQLFHTSIACVCIPILVTTFLEWLSGTEPLPHTTGAVRPSSSIAFILYDTYIEGGQRTSQSRGSDDTEHMLFHSIYR